MSYSTASSRRPEIRDTRPVSQWAEGHRPRNTYIGHDSLYRVAQVSYEYRGESGYGTDVSTDWRDDAAGPNADDPGDRTPRAGARSATSTGRTRRPRPAEMIGQSHGSRIQQLDYEWDYLGNQIRWLDDTFEAESQGEMFYERGIGEITNGNTPGASSSSARPSALYLSTNIDTTGGVDPSWNGAGWVEVDYGTSGNVASFTVHGQCHDASLEDLCTDSTATIAERADHFREVCSCAQEQHHRYRWDELNRLVDGRRHDRAGPSAAWTPAARMRYRYDGANQRTVKESFAEASVSLPERYTLYAYPGDFERRGLTITFDNDGLVYQATEGSGPDATETQYLIAGARIVWDGEPSITGPGIDRNRRATIGASDLLGTTAASLDLESGALLEVSTYCPNGARENLWTNDADVPLEPMGFTGKEADEEIGITYFGERWLIPRLGRWATPDPLHVHAAGGGEALNSYHYVSGNLLQAVDPLGLDGEIVPGIPRRIPLPLFDILAREVSSGILIKDFDLGSGRGSVQFRTVVQTENSLVMPDGSERTSALNQPAVAIGLVGRESTAGPAHWVQFVRGEARATASDGAVEDVMREFEVEGMVPAASTFPEGAGYGRLDSGSFGEACYARGGPEGRGASLTPSAGTGEVIYDAPNSGQAIRNYMRRHPDTQKVEFVYTFSTYLFEGSGDVGQVGPSVRLTWAMREVFERGADGNLLPTRRQYELVSAETEGVELSAEERFALEQQTNAYGRDLASQTSAPERER